MLARGGTVGSMLRLEITLGADALPATTHDTVASVRAAIGRALTDHSLEMPEPLATALLGPIRSALEQDRAWSYTGGDIKIQVRESAVARGPEPQGARGPEAEVEHVLHMVLEAVVVLQERVLELAYGVEAGRGEEWAAERAGVIAHTNRTMLNSDYRLKALLVKMTAEQRSKLPIASNEALSAIIARQDGLLAAAIARQVPGDLPEILDPYTGAVL